MKDRKAFNFYRSYYDVAKQLKEPERSAFVWALIVKQFDDVDTNLEGMAKFAWMSQEHSIKSQIEGYKSNPKGSKKTTPPKGGRQGGSVGGTEGAWQQEKEKGKEKEKEKEEVLRQPKIDINGFVIIEEDDNKPQG